MIVLTGGPNTMIVAWTATLWEQSLVHLHGSSLDHRLAAGDCPDSDLHLAVRARWLVRPKNRDALAASLERLMSDAGEWHCPLPVAPPLVRSQKIDEVSQEIAAVIAKLRRPVPISARGVAMVTLLLCDGRSPLYDTTKDEELRARIQQALEALDPFSDWSW